ncbi:cation diffusion facilitator family transporter [Denitratisoma oestradiolicum]|uniref:Cation diffusion facilitator family transporter n=1 Tax=Denitratisoma oestradiolicum TaxID=311182 RepID=A0A6S6Y661_9PROT|nr:cation diffusion facilitator family transporter [Denitratisoma oestradiolicum]TWO80665.1 cation-efflux pump [Denitratisoma oestradiolicum]CAB1371069.1 Cation diffusion facilitator family transporter [Denitratisoma oestradiolicum]
MIEDAERLRQGQQITWVSVVVNVLLTAMQIVVGLLAHSQSLIADAMHTLSDVVADVFVLFANRKGAEAADAEHPYGHARYETLASLVLGLLLSITGIGILVAAAGRLQNLASLPPVGIAALWAACATLIGKEGLFRYMLVVARRLRSSMLMANAWHARADALSSLVVAAGIGGSLLGFGFADAVAAIIVGAMIVKAGAGFAWDAISELIDTGLSAEEVRRIRQTLEDAPGVLGLHDLRTRRMAHHVLVDAHIQVSPRVSVSEGHLIGERARQRLLQEHPEVLDVLVHVDVEDDMLSNLPATELPERAMLLHHLRQMLGEDLPHFERTTLHYLGNRVEAEVTLPPEMMQDPARIVRVEQRLAQCLPGDAWFSTVSLNCRIAPK